MKKLLMFLKLFVTVSILSYPMQVWAQSNDSTSLSSPLSSNAAWDVYTDVAKNCWLVSAPQKLVNTKGGKKVEVNRYYSYLSGSSLNKEEKFLILAVTHIAVIEKEVVLSLELIVRNSNCLVSLMDK
jgi:hypothetical protein